MTNESLEREIVDILQTSDLGKWHVNQFHPEEKHYASLSLEDIAKALLPLIKKQVLLGKVEELEQVGVLNNQFDEVEKKHKTIFDRITQLKQEIKKMGQDD